MVAMDQDLDVSDHSSRSNSSKSSSWRSALACLKKQLRFLSPIRCLVMTRDSYIKGMNNFASSSHCSALMVQGPHIAPLSRSSSRSVRDDDDLYQLIRAASQRKSGHRDFGDLGLETTDSKPLPRSASVSVAQQGAGMIQRQQGWSRSVSHSGISRFPIQRTVLETTQEE